jgi:hypothetical protein
MADRQTGAEPAHGLDRTSYELEVDDRFDRPILDDRLWIPHYLPHWSSRTASAARYAVGGGSLRMLIEPDQAPWSPEFTGDLRVSSLQTGELAGPVGSPSGQHHFREGLVVVRRSPGSRYIPRNTASLSSRLAPSTTRPTWSRSG